MCALQAQHYLGALWAVGLRWPGTTSGVTGAKGAKGAKGATEADVEAAPANGSIIRTWPMRGTLHFLEKEDARVLLLPTDLTTGQGR